MTWIKFALWLAGLYAFYYAAMILLDYLRQGRRPETDESHELTFVEHVEPVKALPESGGDPHESAVSFSGGVSLKQLFNLAREEAIEYIRPVSY